MKIYALRANIYAGCRASIFGLQTYFQLFITDLDVSNINSELQLGLRADSVAVGVNFGSNSGVIIG